MSRALVDSGVDGGSDLADWIEGMQWTHVRDRCTDVIHATAPSKLAAALAPMNEYILGVLEAAAHTKNAALLGEVHAYLRSQDTGFPVLSLVSLLQDADGAQEPAALQTMMLAELYSHCVRRLEETLAQPPRARDDWSISFAPTCKCDLCAELQRFLVRPDQVKKEWPLAEDRRAHIHRAIDERELPVRHQTTRSGRPYRLVLEKQDVLFATEQRTRKSWEVGRTWLASRQQRFTPG